jgi:broad specificity phosphatase PhoE
MKEIILVRHGETDHNREMRITGFTDVPLNNTGKAQAERLKPKFMSEGITAIYSSDLKRCYETASIISAGAPLTDTPSIREINFGIFETLTDMDARTFHPAEYNMWKGNSEYRVPEGESFNEMAARVLLFFEELVSSEIQRAAVVSHSGCIRTVLAHYLLGGIDDTWRFVIDNCTITRLCFDGDYAYLKSLNEKN